MKQTHIHESTIDSQSRGVEHTGNQVTNSHVPLGLPVASDGGGYYMAQFSTTDQV